MFHNGLLDCFKGSCLRSLSPGLLRCRHGSQADSIGAYLLLEWVENKRQKHDFWEVFGHKMVSSKPCRSENGAGQAVGIMVYFWVDSV